MQLDAKRKTLPGPLETLVSWMMPFGKYAGSVLLGPLGSYLPWFAREGFLEGELDQLLEPVREKIPRFCTVTIN